MSSRDDILKKLRSAAKPYADMPPFPAPRHVVPLADISQQALVKKFAEEAEKLRAQVQQVKDEAGANQAIMNIIGEDKQVLAWDLDKIPLKSLGEALQKAGIEIASGRSGHVRVGITGASAALAATGSLVMMAGAGQLRTASLLPFTHIAVITASQIVPDFETWMAQQRQTNLENFRKASNVTLISGTSRTADIAMQMIMGVHGPGEVHMIILP